MKSQYIKLLKKQIEKLESESFDLEAWKTSAITVLHRIFGETDPRAKQIDQLKIDYSSWALRDSNSNYKPIETAKLKGREVINTAIEEIEIFGAPENHTSKVLGKEYTDDLESMSEKERKKHFDGMKKNKLVELLMKLTSVYFLLILTSCCVGEDCSSNLDFPFNIVDRNGTDLFFGQSATHDFNSLRLLYEKLEPRNLDIHKYPNRTDSNFVFYPGRAGLYILELNGSVIDTIKPEFRSEESQCCTEFFDKNLSANNLNIIDSISFYIVLDPLVD